MPLGPIRTPRSSSEFAPRNVFVPMITGAIATGCS